MQQNSLVSYIVRPVGILGLDCMRVDKDDASLQPNTDHQLIPNDTIYMRINGHVSSDRLKLLDSRIASLVVLSHIFLFLGRHSADFTSSMRRAKTKAIPLISDTQRDCGDGFPPSMNLGSALN